MKNKELMRHLFVQHEALRRLGFPADQIYISQMLLDGVVCWGTVLRTDKEEWSAGVAPSSLKPRVFEKEWVTFLKEVRRSTDRQLDRWWARYMPVERFTAITFSIENKGIPIPKLSN